ncbi:MAG: hypothetical protein LBV07_05475 [Syntrophobacterales bacterium]|jgi:hypothetical protein|nr:hypothetical protein [Syntrophobacterales bacterium]
MEIVIPPQNNRKDGVKMTNIFTNQVAWLKRLCEKLLPASVQIRRIFADKIPA